MNVNLVRTRRGSMVHRADCPHAQPRPVTGQDKRWCQVTSGGVPWHWADEQTEDVIVSVIAGCGYRTCRHCKPVDENKLASWVLLGYLKAVER